MPARPARCPKCGWTYGWGGGYCSHCRIGRPDRDRWAALQSLRDFPDHTTDGRAHLRFAAGCLRRVVGIADPAVGPLLAAIEHYAVGACPASEVSLLIPPDMVGEGSPAGSLHDPRDARGMAGRAVVRAAQFLSLGEPGYTPAGVAARASADARQAVGLAARPLRDFWSYPLPPGLEPDREAARRWHAQPPSMRSRDEAAVGAYHALREAEAVDQAGRTAAERAEEVVQCGLFRDVVPYPFEPLVFDPDWRTGSVVALARTMYEAGDFVHMPILADALEDAGCADPQVIGHCRDPDQPHVRGCWVVEAVLAPAGN